MGQPKLLLSWQGEPLIAHFLRAWRATPVAAIVAIVRKDDEALAAACRKEGAIVVQPPLDPPDMKSSVLHGLEKLRQDFAPADEDYWLLAPADMPLLSSNSIQLVLDACRQHPGDIVVPQYDGRRGHPAAFPWSLARQVAQLPPEGGLNLLVRDGCVHEVRVSDGAVLVDVDTPEEYEQLTDRPQRP